MKISKDTTVRVMISTTDYGRYTIDSEARQSMHDLVRAFARSSPGTPVTLIREYDDFVEEGRDFGVTKTEALFTATEGQ